MLADHLRPIFWDINPETFDPAAYPEYTIGRILELGNERAVAWLRATFPSEQIAGVVRGERRLSRRSANFWALVYGIPPEQVAALRGGS